MSRSKEKNKNKSQKIATTSPCSGGENSDDLRHRIDYSLIILERIDSWINSCDNKMSMLIGIISIVFTLFLSTDSLSKVYLFVIDVLLNDIDPHKCVFILSMLIDLCFYIITIHCIVEGLSARVDVSRYSKEGMSTYSNLYFGSVSRRDFLQFKTSFINESVTEQINDILSQVYINSEIARIKYKHYNSGLKWTGISMLSTVALLLWAIIGFK